MKKIVALVISLIILVCGVAFQGESASGGAVIKRGNGKSERVTTIKTLANVLDSITNRFSDDDIYASADDDNTIEGVAQSPFGGEEEEVEYTDAVLTFDTYGATGIDISAESSFGSYSMTTNATFNRSMTCLFTKDAAYYYIDAEIRTSSSGNIGGEDSNIKAFISIEAELYITEEASFMRLIEMTLLMDGNDIDFGEMLGKWIDCSEGGAGEINSVNAQNYEQLSVIGNYIDQYEVGGFKKNGSIYTLKEEPCKSLCLELFSLAGMDSLPDKCLDRYDFSVDFSDSTTPVMDLSYVIKYDEDSQKVGGVENTRITISDINRGNTVTLPESAEIYKLSDFEDLM